MTSDILSPNEMTPDTTGWKGRHIRYAKGEELAVMIRAMYSYAAKHEERFGQPVSRDGFIGPRVLDILNALRDLLNGEIGMRGLDGGTCDGAILKALDVAGYEEGRCGMTAKATESEGGQS
jgi:hypothetical protein